MKKDMEIKEEPLVTQIANSISRLYYRQEHLYRDLDYTEDNMRQIVCDIIKSKVGDRWNGGVAHILEQDIREKVKIYDDVNTWECSQEYKDLMSKMEDYIDKLLSVLNLNCSSRIQSDYKNSNYVALCRYLTMLEEYMAFFDYYSIGDIDDDTGFEYVDGKIELINDLVIDGSDIITCEDCGEYIRKNIYEVNSRYGATKYVCGCCIDDYYCCRECGEYFESDEGSYDIYDDWYCNDCIDNGYGTWEDEEEYRDVGSYHHTSSFRVLKENNEDTNVTTYGFELETEPTDCDKLEFTNDEVTNDAEFIAHRDNDNSLRDGVEFVSNAMTYRYIKNHREDITEFLKTLGNMGYTSHNNGRCGLHFHIGSYNGQNNLTDEENAKIVYFIHNNWEWFKKFSRRNNFEYCGDINLSYKAKSTKSKIKEIVNNKSYKNSSHYCFYIDRDCRTNTSELRLWRGTLNPITFFASFYMTNAIVQVARNNARLTFSNIKKYLQKQGDYDIVMRYLNTRDLNFENEMEGKNKCA